MLKKNKIYAIFFAAIVLMVVAMPMFVTYKLLSHKNKVINQIEKSKQLVTLKMSITEYNEYKCDEHELNIHGKMFDIESKKVDGTEIEVIGHFDDTEDKVLDTLKHSFEKNKNKETISFFSFFYVEKCIHFKSKINVVTGLKHISSYAFSIPINFIKTDNPPPNYI